jgi:hypothetical protein
MDRSDSGEGQVEGSCGRGDVVSESAGNFLTSCGTVSFLIMSLFHGVVQLI